MLSKEILSEVLNLKGIISIEIDKNTVIVNYAGLNFVKRKEINIYELAFKCLFYMQTKKAFNVNFKDDWWDRLEPKISVVFYDDNKTIGNLENNTNSLTVLNNIFKATEWVYKNTRSK